MEFTVEPFVEGLLGAHVEAALDLLASEGFPPDVGPFGSSVEGDSEPLLAALARAAGASFDAGASAITVTAHVVDAAGGQSGEDDSEEFLAAIGPAARAMGATVVRASEMSGDAVPLAWKGRVVGGLETRFPNDLRNGLSNLVAQVEAELGARLGELDRVGKQRAVRVLDDRGAFALRNAVDEIADAMGVSRVTVYNYLNATRSAPPQRAG